MNDPVRLLEVGADEFEAELLQAGRSDAMPSHSRQQILAGIGIGGLLTASTVATGVRAAAKGWFGVAGVGTVGVLAAWVGIHTLSAASHTRATSTQSAPIAMHVAPALQPTNPATAAPPADVVNADPEPVSATAPVKVVPHAAADDSLTAELSAIEQARTALLNHDPAQTLRLLDDYKHHFSKRRLRSEATVLRIEALSARGDSDAATRVGRDFLQNHPNGPYAQRVRSVIGDAAPSAHSE